MLAIIAAIVQVLGPVFVNPCEYFMPIAQAISSRPATNSCTHAILRLQDSEPKPARILWNHTLPIRWIEVQLCEADRSQPDAGGQASGSDRSGGREAAARPALPCDPAG